MTTKATRYATAYDANGRKILQERAANKGKGVKLARELARYSNVRVVTLDRDSSQFTHLAEVTILVTTPCKSGLLCERGKLAKQIRL